MNLPKSATMSLRKKTTRNNVIQRERIFQKNVDGVEELAEEYQGQQWVILFFWHAYLKWINKAKQDIFLEPSTFLFFAPDRRYYRVHVEIKPTNQRKESANEDTA